MKKGALKNITNALGANGIILIVVAALLLIGIYIIMYQFTRDEINEDVRLRSQSELMAKSLTIQNIMNEVETAVRNHVGDVEKYLDTPDSMFSVAKNLVELNPKITGSSISFIENYYPEKGKWFEAYAVREGEKNISTLQLGSANHDYFQSEFFDIPLKTGKGGWSNPYLDSEGAKMLLTTYSEPVYNKEGEIIAVIDADISLDWLDEVLTTEYAYPSSYHVLLSKNGKLMSVVDKNYLLKTIPEMGTDYGNETFNLLNEGMLSGKSGETIIKDKKGEKYLAYYMPIGGDAGLSIAIINSEKEIFGDFHKMRVTILWLSIGGFIILVLLIYRSIVNIKKLEKITTERERIKSELKIASEIQAGLLPKGGEINATEEGVEVGFCLNPAKEVGGDLYDYFIKNNLLYFCIGDVSGKGVPAALFMAVARSLLRALSLSSQNPASIISGMNDTLEEFNERGMFVTLFLGILDLSTGRLKFCNAGHDSPLIIDSNGVGYLNVYPNLPIGVLPGFEYRSQMVQLRKGEIMFLYTDGLTEAMNSGKQEFGEERMKKFLETCYSSDTGISAGELVNKMKEKIREFVGKAEQSDDLTMLAFKFYRNDNFPEKSIILKNEIKDISRLNRFIEYSCHEQDLTEDFINELKLAIEEIVVNSINYGYEDKSEGEISVNLKFQPKEVLVAIKDTGSEFDPTLEKDIDFNANIEERQIGGLGLFLAKQFTDSISYRRVGNYNILSLSKKY